VRLGIVGSRKFPDRDLVEKVVARIAFKAPDTIIVSGGALGVDTWAAEEARRHGLVVIEYKPDYDRYGRYLAPKMRNTTIVEDSDKLLAFWDGKSGGTMDSVEKARALGKPVEILTSPR